jgi:LmbE family N-acetylglucosaminyl deacetylase
MDRWLAEMKAQGALDAYTDLELGADDARITTVLDVTDVAAVRQAAIAEHRTQFSPFTGVSADLEQLLMSRDYLIRRVPP